jgi:hypothetical protein
MKEAEVEFDLVRRALHSKIKRSQDQKDAIVQSQNLAIFALWGAEVAADRQGKEAEAVRLRRWRREALLR